MLPTKSDAPIHWYLQAPNLDEVTTAANRIARHLIQTPLLESERVNHMVGGRLLVKAEGLQHTGSFKARGTWNMMSALSSAGELGGGVICGSSGNHGQAVAWAARHFGVPAVIMMPHDAPQIKVARTADWGAEVIRYNRFREDRDEIGKALIRERRLTLIPPFEDRRIVAGAGTLALEIAEQACSVGATPDALVVNCSGGGMAAGCSLTLGLLAPSVEVWATEPEGFDDLRRSLAKGEVVPNEQSTEASICDSLMAPKIGHLTFGIMAKYLKGAVTVTDDEVLAAMRLIFSEFRVVAEPGGAAGLAAILSKRIDARGRTVAVVLSGSNVDETMFEHALRQ